MDLAFDAEDGLYKAEESIYDVIVLDLMLRSVNGEEVLRRLRRKGSICLVLVLTAKEGKNHLIAVLNSGADDYLAKPFDMGELVARIKIIIRRSQGHAVSRLALDTLELNFSERSVRRFQKFVQLTPME